MNHLMFTVAGIFAGFLLATNLYKPDLLKTNLASQNTALDICQSQLKEAETKITGMLMNKD